MKKLGLLLYVSFVCVVLGVHGIESANIKGFNRSELSLFGKKSFDDIQMYLDLVKDAGPVSSAYNIDYINEIPSYTIEHVYQFLVFHNPYFSHFCEYVYQENGVEKNVSLPLHELIYKAYESCEWKSVFLRQRLKSLYLNYKKSCIDDNLIEKVPQQKAIQLLQKRKKCIFELETILQKYQSSKNPFLQAIRSNLQTADSENSDISHFMERQKDRMILRDFYNQYYREKRNRLQRERDLANEQNQLKCESGFANNAKQGVARAETVLYGLRNHFNTNKQKILPGYGSVLLAALQYKFDPDESYRKVCQEKQNLKKKRLGELFDDLLNV
jgi:hypothetical protein